MSDVKRTVSIPFLSQIASKSDGPVAFQEKQGVEKDPEQDIFETIQETMKEVCTTQLRVYSAQETQYMIIREIYRVLIDFLGDKWSPIIFLPPRQQAVKDHNLWYLDQCLGEKFMQEMEISLLSQRYTQGNNGYVHPVLYRGKTKMVWKHFPIGTVSVSSSKGIQSKLHSSVHEIPASHVFHLLSSESSACLKIYFQFTSVIPKPNGEYALVHNLFLEQGGRNVWDVFMEYLPRKVDEFMMLLASIVHQLDVGIDKDGSVYHCYQEDLTPKNVILSSGTSSSFHDLKIIDHGFTIVECSRKDPICGRGILSIVLDPLEKYEREYNLFLKSFCSKLLEGNKDRILNLFCSIQAPRCRKAVASVMDTCPEMWKKIENSVLWIRDSLPSFPDLMSCFPRQKHDPFNLLQSRKVLATSYLPMAQNLFYLFFFHKIHSDASVYQNMMWLLDQSPWTVGLTISFLFRFSSLFLNTFSEVDSQFTLDYLFLYVLPAWVGLHTTEDYSYASLLVPDEV